MSIISVVLTVIAVILLIPTVVVFAQVLSACLSKRKADVNIADDDISIAVLIPAHNESSGIIATLNSIRSQLTSKDRLLVVADNCDDDTAAVALANGAEVIERHDAAKRGKGFALDFGIRHLAQNPSDIVVFVDADCILEANALKPLAAYALKHGRPVQALYLMYSKVANLKSSIAEFAWCVKNLVRPLGYAQLSLPCQLMGTGMAFPWSTIAKADLANGNIVEDMKLGIDLSIAGTPPLFYLNAKVTSYFPVASDVQTGQSTRWEHGHLAMILSEAPRLFIKGAIKCNKDLLAMALDLSVPPLALLVTLLFGYAIATGIMGIWFDFAYVAFQVTLIGVILLTIAIAIAWWGWGRNIISLASMLLVPVYVFLKIPHYIKFMFKRQKTWNKTERDEVD
ncbi:MAG TPA: glycosyltransferase family 2 protein [Methylotenera sp.]|nr:glycosyltransferase family 2 protein [Methylotenera sp.]